MYNVISPLLLLEAVKNPSVAAVVLTSSNCKVSLSCCKLNEPEYNEEILTPFIGMTTSSPTLPMCSVRASEPKAGAAVAVSARDGNSLILPTTN